MDKVHEAQQALQRCLMFPIANERPSCYEERAELKKAQARLAYCEQKTERVRHWQQTMRHELFEYEGRISQLVKLVEIEVPQSIGVLNKIMRAPGGISCHSGRRPEGVVRRRRHRQSNLGREGARIVGRRRRRKSGRGY